MILNQHPEYKVYLQDRELWIIVQRAVQTWESAPQPLPIVSYGLVWNYASVREFILSLSDMLKAYNQVLWEDFPYCRSCLGQCCLRGGAFIAVFDLLALACLDLPYPCLPERIEARSNECIYRSAAGCLWPAGWRTMKCWLFYCLGSAVPDRPARQPPLRRQILSQLRTVLDGCLPEPLRAYERQQGIDLSSQLDDPLVCAEALGQALFELLIGPLGKRFPEILPPGRLPYYKDSESSDKANFSADAEWEAFLANFDCLLESQPQLVSLLSDAWLEDIETLEWIALGRPSQGAGLLEDMLERYQRLSPLLPDFGAARVMRHRIQHLLKELYAVPPGF